MARARLEARVEYRNAEQLLLMLLLLLLLG